jgi:hypothetical protein
MAVISAHFVSPWRASTTSIRNYESVTRSRTPACERAEIATSSREAAGIAEATGRTGRTRCTGQAGTGLEEVGRDRVRVVWAVLDRAGLDRDDQVRCRGFVQSPGHHARMSACGTAAVR